MAGRPGARTGAGSLAGVSSRRRRAPTPDAIRGLRIEILGCASDAGMTPEGLPDTHLGFVVGVGYAQKSVTVGGSPMY